MAGVKDFLSIEGTYWFRYAAFDLSTAGVGLQRIFSSGALPGQAPRFEGRNWLKAGSPYLRRGPVFDITEIYWLSNDGGWPEAVYEMTSNGRGNGTGLGSSGGLQTGGL